MALRSAVLSRFQSCITARTAPSSSQPGKAYKYRSAVETGALGPTDAMRDGDFSALGVPIYDPATTTFNGTHLLAPNLHPGVQRRTGQHGFVRRPHQLHPSQPDQSDLGALPVDHPDQRHHWSTGATSLSPEGPRPTRIRERFASIRTSATITRSCFATASSICSRQIRRVQLAVPSYTFPATTTSGTGLTPLVRRPSRTCTSAETTDTHSPAPLMPARMRRFIRQLQTLGMSTYFMTLNNTVYAPQYTADGYVGLSGSQLQDTGLADDWQFGGSFTKILGRHTIKAGADFETNNFTSPIAYSNIGFRIRANRGCRGKSRRRRK